MRTFKVNENIEVVCEWQKTRYGFRHLATLIRNNQEVDKAKCCYYNRTWESYEYESVLRALLHKTKELTDKEKIQFKEMINNPDRINDDLKGLKTIGSIAMLGSLFGNTKKEKNNWKKRMLKAGLGENLNLPDDFDGLPEEEKERRLDGAIGILRSDK